MWIKMMSVLDGFQELFLRSIGGKTLEDCVRRTWAALLSDDTAALCNWAGRYGKTGLKDYALIDIVFGEFSVCLMMCSN